MQIRVPEINKGSGRKLIQDGFIVPHVFRKSIRKMLTFSYQNNIFVNLNLENGHF